MPHDHEALKPKSIFRFYFLKSKYKEVETSNLLAKLISMKYKERGNIREYKIEMFNLTPKHKSIKLELGEDLLVHLVLISLPAHFGRTNGPSMILYLSICNTKRGCRQIRLKVFTLLRLLRIRKGKTLKVLWKSLLSKRNKRRVKNLLVTYVRSQDT
ncbi:hypothetical protein CR513_04210, partial [Mucuna pruriens]